MRRAFSTHHEPSVTCRRRCAAFTLLELVVTIGIIALIVTFTIPFVSKMLEIGDGQSGRGSISVASNAVRILNQRLSEDDLGGQPGAPANADYSGTIALFTPQGEIRFAINDQYAEDTSGDFLEALVNYDPTLNGYRDIGPPKYDELNYLQLPTHARVAGVLRTGSGIDDISVFAPPFALRFDEYGHLAMDQAFVYYDGKDYGGQYDVNDIRSNGYNPDTDAQFTKIKAGTAITGYDVYKYPQPFERIEVVTSVILYDARQFRAAGLTWGATADNAAVRDWLLANGTPIFFSPHTGLVLKE